jgi:lipopolysaccharide/colanic/teichoic acid biosynthesis glycosyltransferase
MQPFRKLISARIYVLSFIEAVLALGCYTAAVFIHFPLEAPLYLLYEGGVQHMATMTLIFVVASYLFDSYKQIRVSSRLVSVLQVTNLIGLILVVHAVLAFFNRELIAPQAIILWGSGIALVVLAIWRLYLRPAAWNAIGAQRVLFVGVDPAVERLATVFLEQPSFGRDVRGYVLDREIPADVAPVLGCYSDLMTIVSKIRPDAVVVSGETAKGRRILHTLFELRSAGVTVQSASDVYETIFGRVYSRGVEPYSVIFRNELSAGPGSIALQSIYNNLLAVTSVVIMSPVLVLIAVALKLSKRGPVFVKHRCVGLYGQEFARYRFRCDSSNALGRFLLKTKLEAVPQILNIFRGEMSLIGPRPERAEFSRIIDGMIPFYRQRYSVKPGVMGWSQLQCDTAPSEDTLARVEYDLYYLKHISLVLDAYILLRAVKWIVSGRGMTMYNEGHNLFEASAK